tara:strand:- start:5657 stop:5863 length:207 start_codon:yes stop_codon:yes gene_type:complete
MFSRVLPVIPTVFAMHFSWIGLATCFWVDYWGKIFKSLGSLSPSNQDDLIEMTKGSVNHVATANEFKK